MPPEVKQNGNGGARLHYVPNVPAVKAWSIENGSFDPFEGTAVLVKTWKSKKGNTMARFKATDGSAIRNCQAGLFIEFDNTNPDSKLLLWEGENWTINPEVPFKVSSLDGVSL